MTTFMNLPPGTLPWAAAVLAAAGAFAVFVVLTATAAGFKAFSSAPESSPRALVHKLLRRLPFTTPLLISAAVGVLVLSLFREISAPTLVIAWSVVWRMAIICVAIQLFSWAGTFVDWAGALWIRRRAIAEGQADPAVAGAMGTFRWLFLLVAYAAILLLALENFGIDVTALVAGLGVGGIAVALAVQNILGDLFASLTITLDKPFVVGDFIIVGTEMGTIEKVGLKTTRVRSLGGEQLIFGNNDLLSSRIRNYKRMQERRIVFAFGVTYQTTPEQLAKITEHVRSIITEHKLARFDRCHFHKFGASSLDFEVVYFTLKPDYNVYMDVQQEINLELMRRLASEGIEFAYPTQTLYLDRVARPDPAR